MTRKGPAVGPWWLSGRGILAWLVRDVALSVTRLASSRVSVGRRDGGVLPSRGQPGFAQLG